MGKLIKGRTTNGIGAIQNEGSYSYDKTDSNGICAGTYDVIEVYRNGSQWFTK